MSILNHSPTIVRDGLILCLDAGAVRSYSGSGSNWDDIAGASWIRGEINGATFSAEGGAGGTKSFSFDGTNDYISLGTQINSSIAQHVDCSFCCWFRVDAIDADQVIFSTPTIGGNKPFIVWFDLAAVATSNTGGSDVGGETTEVITVMVTDSGAEYRYTTANNALSANTWYHLCVVLNPSGDKFYTYLDGAQVALFNSSACDGIKTFADDFNIGDTSSSSIDGKIAIVQAYNRALSATEVAQNYRTHKGRFGK
jgi:hypothetical protein